MWNGVRICYNWKINEIVQEALYSTKQNDNCMKKGKHDQAEIHFYIAVLLYAIKACFTASGLVISVWYIL